VQFIGVAWYGDQASFQGFVDKYSLSFPQLSDNPGAIFSRFNVPAQPALVVIDRTGKVNTMLGAVEPDALDQVLTTALA
jgi:peroxiredoxin